MSATNRGAVRNPRDFYATPEAAFKPLLPYLPVYRRFYEPACGDGRLVRWLRDSGRECDGADLEPQDPAFPIRDFLKDTTPREFVITNPPFSIAEEFLKHALEFSPEVLFLLRLNFLGSVRRHELLNRQPPAAMFVLSKRPSFTGRGTDACEYAWIYWGKRFEGIFFPAVQNRSKP